MFEQSPKNTLPTAVLSPCRQPDGVMPLALAVGALVSLWLGWVKGQMVLAAALSLACLVPALLALTVLRSTVWLRPMAPLAGVGLVGTHLYLSQASPEAYASVFLLGSLLPAYRSWKLVAVAGLMLAGVHLCLASTMPVHMDSEAILCALALQYAYLAHVARREACQEGERFELDFLIRATGSDGPIRLNLDVLRADSAVGQRFKHIQQRMADAIRQVQRSIDGVQRASQVLGHDSEELSERTLATAAGLRDAAMCLEQINVIVQTSAQASREARAMAAQATGLADNGGQQVKQLVDTMQAIARSSHQITDIIAVIDGIAFQTNILALNASVEAARAGEQGRGFAVVASEVRNLALRSAEAAQEIKALINESMRAVDAGVTQVQVTGNTMDDLVRAVRRVGEVFERLSADSHEHASGIEVVTQSVKELDGVTQQNIGLAESSSAIAGELTAHAQQMLQVLSAFKLGDAPAATVPGAAAPPHPLARMASGASAAVAAAARPTPALRTAAQPAPTQSEGIEFF